MFKYPISNLSHSNKYFFKKLAKLRNMSNATNKLDKSAIENAKMVANKKCVSDRTFQDNMVIGIGSGSTVVYAAKFIAEKLESLKQENCAINVICIPSSFQAKQLIIDNNLTLGSLESYPEVEWTIDGTDEVDEQMNLIKGGGGCQTQEKILASCSKKLYIVADNSKHSSKLGSAWKKGVPIEVIPMSYVPVKNKIEKTFGGEAKLRIAVAKAGPCVTDNGNFILDWIFPSDIDQSKWIEVNTHLLSIPGVVETGLFLGMASKVYVGSPDGKVVELGQD